MALLRTERKVSVPKGLVEAGQSASSRITRHARPVVGWLSGKVDWMEDPALDISWPGVLPEAGQAWPGRVSAAKLSFPLVLS